MKKLKLSLQKYAEFYLLFAVLLYWVMTVLFNPIAIALLGLILFQIWKQKKGLGIIIASIFLLLNIYMLFALASEFNEFPTFDFAAGKLLFVGLLFLVPNIMMAWGMMVKYVEKDKIPIL